VCGTESAGTAGVLVGTISLLMDKEEYVIDEGRCEADEKGYETERSGLGYD
jgi:hypothetical protein